MAKNLGFATHVLASQRLVFVCTWSYVTAVTISTYLSRLQGHENCRSLILWLTSILMPFLCLKTWLHFSRSWHTCSHTWHCPCLLDDRKSLFTGKLMWCCAHTVHFFQVPFLQREHHREYPVDWCIFCALLTFCAGHFLVFFLHWYSVWSFLESPTRCVNLQSIISTQTQQIRIHISWELSATAISARNWR